MIFNMVLHKRTLAVCFLVPALGLMMICFWPGPAFKPSIRLPPGVALAEVLHSGKGDSPKGWHTNIYCLEDGRRGTKLSPATLRGSFRHWLHEVRGQTLWRAPNPPAGDFLTPRLGECFQASGEKYLLAKEFVWEVSSPVQQNSEFTFLYFVWGGTNKLRHARDVVGFIEDGILKSGISGIRFKWSLPQQRGVRIQEYLPTNQCAVIRDVKGLVKIVPLDNLKAYLDAGLVTLPNRE